MHFCLGFIWKVVLKKELKMNHAQMYPKDPDSPCRELSNGGLKIALALPVCPGIGFLCVHTGKAIQLYVDLISTSQISLIIANLFTEILVSSTVLRVFLRSMPPQNWGIYGGKPQNSIFCPLYWHPYLLCSRHWNSLRILAKLASFRWIFTKKALAKARSLQSHSLS